MQVPLTFLCLHSTGVCVCAKRYETEEPGCLLARLLCADGEAENIQAPENKCWGATFMTTNSSCCCCTLPHLIPRDSSHALNLGIWVGSAPNAYWDRSSPGINTLGAGMSWTLQHNQISPPFLFLLLYHYQCALVEDWSLPKGAYNLKMNTGRHKEAGAQNVVTPVMRT